MVYLRHTPLYLVLILLLAICFDSIDAKGRRTSRGRSRPSGGSRSRGLSKPKTGGSHTSGRTSPGRSSNLLIHSEGGGRTRPSTTSNNRKPTPSPHKPSAKPKPTSNPHPNSPHNPGKPVSHPGSPPNPTNSPHGMPRPHQAPRIGFIRAHQSNGSSQSHAPVGSSPTPGGYSNSPGGYSHGGNSNQPTVVHVHVHVPVENAQNRQHVVMPHGHHSSDRGGFVNSRNTTKISDPGSSSSNYPAWANPGANPNRGSNPHALTLGAQNRQHVVMPHGHHSSDRGGFVNSRNTTKISDPGSSSSNYPAWANPGANPNRGSNPHVPTLPRSHSSQGSNMTHNPSPKIKPSQPLVPYPLSHQQSNGPLGMPMSNSDLHPNSPHSSPQAPHIGFHGTHQPTESPENHKSFGSSPNLDGHSHSQGEYSHGGIPHGGHPDQSNHLNAPVGNPQNSEVGQPGQTVGALANQQSSDKPGIGERLKKKLANSVEDTVGKVKDAVISSAVDIVVKKLVERVFDDKEDDNVETTEKTSSTSTNPVTDTVIDDQSEGTPVGLSVDSPTESQPDSSSESPSDPVDDDTSVAPENSNVTSNNNSSNQTDPVQEFQYYPTNEEFGTTEKTSSISTNPVTDTVTYDQSELNYGNPPNAGTSQIQTIPETQVGLSVDSPTGSQPGSSPESPSHPVDEDTSVAPENSDMTSNNNSSNQTDPVQEFQYDITNEELWTLTEKLFNEDEFNGSNYIDVTSTICSTEPNIDLCPEKLLYVKNETYAVPTIQAIREMYSNYEFNWSMQETIKSEQEKLFIDEILNTGVMRTAMEWLTAKRYINPGNFEWENVLRQIWMTRVDLVTSGFERVFMAEKYPGPNIIGGHNWIYFDSQELAGRVHYLSYVDKVELANKAQLLKVNFMLDDVVRPNTTMLVGTSPELEMALYTICFYARTNDNCTVSLGGSKLNIYTHFFQDSSNFIIDIGFPFF